MDEIINEPKKGTLLLSKSGSIMNKVREGRTIQKMLVESLETFSMLPVSI